MGPVLEARRMYLVAQFWKGGGGIKGHLVDPTTGRTRYSRSSHDTDDDIRLWLV